MAILISCFGLFGLSGFIAEKRTKEIGIRKVLGASPYGIWISLSKELLKPVSLGFLIASPLAALVMSKLLFTAGYHIDLSWWIFVLSGIGALILALCTVSYHGIKAAQLNPAESLKSE
jgi:ABC-type antimicrobial peptide transport system permease subunit